MSLTKPLRTICEISGVFGSGFATTDDSGMLSAGLMPGDEENKMYVEEDQQAGANISKCTSALNYAPNLKEISCIMYRSIKTHART